MEVETARSSADSYIRSSDSDDRIVEQRLARLLHLNAEIARDNHLFPTERDRLDASLMSAPIDSKKAIGYFGVLIGTLPPFALLLKLVSETSPAGQMDSLFLVLLGIAGVITGLSGYASRKFVSSAVERSSYFRLPNRIAALSVIGLAWGAVSGAVGGLFILVFGSIFGGIFGGAIGAVTLPILIGLQSFVRRGDLVDMRHFLPIAFGITLTLCALILGA
jgi:hypothetical protein